MNVPCDICFEHFDLKSHRPKSLPCGHTFCSKCLQNPSLERKCATCRKAFTTGPAELPDNIFALRVLEAEGQRVASPDDVHQLQRGVAACAQVVQLLEQMVPLAVDALNAQLVSSRAQLQQMKRAVEAVKQGKLTGAVAATQLQLAKQMEDSHRLLTASKCVLHVEDMEGATRRFSLQPNHLARIMLLEHRAHGEGDEEEADGGNHPAPHAPFVGPPGTFVLTIGKEDLYGGNLKVDEILRDVGRWKLARCLKDVRGANSEKLLRVMAPQLEELQFSPKKGAEVGPRVMEEVGTMKALRRLMVQCKKNEEGYPDLPLQLEELQIWEPSENQLRCVQRMPRLRSLEVLNYQGAEVLFPPAQHGGLLWLSVALWRAHQATMLSLIRAHAASLQELRIACEAEDDNVPGGWYFPDLGELLAASGLVSLRRLVLWRPDNNCTATHACLLQRRAIRALLPHSVDVFCLAC